MPIVFTDIDGTLVHYPTTSDGEWKDEWGALEKDVGKDECGYYVDQASRS
jgi:hypothetical protein